MKIALVQEYLIKMGGAERVLIDFLDLFDDPPIFTFLLDRRNLLPPLRDKPDIYPSFLQRYPLAVPLYRYYFPLMPFCAESFNFEGFDVVITSSYQFAKGVVVPEDVLHIAYIHTPTRFLWLERKEGWWQTPILRWLREWDYLSAQRPDVIVANSHNVARRIFKFYRRKAKVIYPGIHVEKYSLGTPKDYFLYVSRLEPHKRADLAVKAFLDLPYRLKVVGEGSELARLKKMAKGAHNIEFLGFVSEEELTRLYRECLALIFPQEEDFGLVPLEVQACGRPVIAYGRGGALETVKEKETGVFFFPQTVSALKKAIKQFFTLEFDPQKIRQWAERFSSERFKKECKKLLEELTEKRKQGF